ncbi:hypothetical protein CNY89_25945, partial [Amaricoccus sp. HAR-UPW-R2A-40]
FYTGAGFAPSENIVIRGNTIVSSDVRHGVFIFTNSTATENTSDAVRHKNILVEDNYIRSVNTPWRHGDPMPTA